MKKPEKCSSCKGSGEQAGAGHQLCPECKGRGAVSYGQGGFSISRPCPRCFGKGSIPGHPCEKCNGQGFQSIKKKIRIKIPAGIEDGGKIRLRGIGYPGKNGGHDGDLIVIMNVEKDQQFERDGHDIRTTIEIPYPTAVLGGKTTIRTLSKKINLTIPAGTIGGTVMRLKGLGLTVEGNQGDQYVTINIAVPKTLTDKQQKLIQELGETF